MMGKIFNVNCNESEKVLIKIHCPRKLRKDVPDVSRNLQSFR